MKSTGITRRIDELGRIVVPKEIRKNMHIKPGELLEIYLLDNDSLVLKRYNTINKKNNTLQKMIDVVTKKLDFNIFITDFNKIIFSNKKNLEELQLSDGIELKKNDSILYLTENYMMNKPFSFYNLCINGDLIGYVIFEYNKTNINKEIENILLSIVEKCLENE